MSGWTGFAFTSPLGRILETHVFCCYKPCWISPQSPCFTHTGRAIGEIPRGGRAGQSVSLFLILVHVAKLPLIGSYQTGPSHRQWMRVLALSPAFLMLLTFGILQGSAGKWSTTPSLSTPTPANAKNGKAPMCLLIFTVSPLALRLISNDQHDVPDHGLGKRWAIAHPCMLFPPHRHQR